MGKALYRRSCRLDLENRRLTNPPFTIEFEAEFATSGKPNLATVRMFNPSKETIEAAAIKSTSAGKVYPKIRVSAGYDDDMGQFIIGEVYSYTVDPKRPDVVLEMKVSDATSKWTQGFISKTYAEGAFASFIIKDVLNTAGLETDSIDLGNDFEYENGLTLNESVASALSRLAKDTDSQFFLRSGRLLFQKQDKPGTLTLVKLASNSGLINAPKKTDKGWKFDSLINYRIGAGTIVFVESPTANGTFRIFKGKHSFLETEATTSFEATAVSI